MTRKTKLPVWALLLALAVLAIGYGLVLADRVPAPAAPKVCDTWIVRDVIEANPAPGVGRIVFQRQGISYAHNFPTALTVGDKVLLRIDFDCAGRRLATTDVER